MMRFLARWTMRMLAFVAGLLTLYVLAALACALLPSGGRPQLADAADPPVFVCASFVHTDILMPIDDDAADWRSAFPEVAAGMPDSIFLAIGWGDLGFYRDTPQWRDVRPGTVYHALAGLGPTTLHVVAVNPPHADSGCVKLAVDREGRKALANFILATARKSESGPAQLILAPERGEGFYTAGGRYSPWRTCNVWASEAIAQAGLPAARWAPFSFGVLWPLKTAQPFPVSLKIP